LAHVESINQNCRPLTVAGVLRIAFVLAAASTLESCATVVPPTSVKFAPARAVGPLPNVVDARPAHAKAYREENLSSSISKYFADDTFEPTFIELLRYRLADALPPHLRNARVELRQADIGFWIPLSSSPMGNAYVPSGAPAGAVILGNLLGYSIVQGIRRATANEFGVAYIVIAVDDQPVPASETVAISKDNKPDEAVRTAVVRALDILAQRVAAFQPEAGVQ
jgi:hypothetical protein